MNPAVSNFDLNVLSFNIWGIPYVSKHFKSRINAIATVLAGGCYDIVSLQEVWSEASFIKIKEKTKEVLPYSHYFYSGVFGSGLCIFSKYPIVTAFFHAWSVNGYVHRVHHGDWFGGKGVGMAKINVNENIVHFYVAHLHAEYNRNNDDYSAHRAVQAFDTAQFIENTRGDSVLQILAGDLNTEPGDLAYRALIMEGHLIDSFDPAYKRSGTNENPTNSFTSLNKKLMNQCSDGKRIDYIMYRPGNSVDVERVMYKLPLPNFIPDKHYSYSDHEAVLTRLSVKKRKDIPEPDKNFCPLDRVPVITDKARKAILDTIEECIHVCNTRLCKIEQQRTVYLTLSLILSIMLFQFIDLHPFWGFHTLYFLLKIFLFLMFLFCIFMGTLWNKLERNGVLSGKLAMELAMRRPILT